MNDLPAIRSAYPRTICEGMNGIIPRRQFRIIKIGHCEYRREESQPEKETQRAREEKKAKELELANAKWREVRDQQ